MLLFMPTSFCDTSNSSNSRIIVNLKFSKFHKTQNALTRIKVG